MNSTTLSAHRPLRQMLNKVPEVTLLFWVIKIMSTTVGETAADFLAGNLGLGLTATSALMTLLLVVALAVQLRQGRYVPWVYWLTVVLVSVVGTLISDNLVDNFGVSLWTTTALFGVGLAVTFTLWWRREHTLSIHDIDSPTREWFYWAAILFTFALGTSAGDLFSEKMSLGYLPSAGIFGAVIAMIAVAWWRGGLGPVLSFWAAYVLTRPFGASVGDFLTAKHGGLGLGTNAVSLVFLACIIAIVVWFTRAQDRSTTHPTGAV